jgi:isopentenyl phosphate kinase
MFVVIKLGGSVITDKKKEKSFKKEVVARLGEEISEVLSEKEFDLIEKYGLSTNKAVDNKVGAEETNKEMDELVSLVVETLNGSGLNVVPLRPETQVNSDGIVSMDLDGFKEAIGTKKIPVIGGFVAKDISGGYRILSGDTLVPYLAKEFNADLVVVGSDVDGIYTDNPLKNKNAKVIPKINSENVDSFNIGGSGGVDVSGGMRKKVDELLDLAKHGIESQIINLNKDGLLRDALKGEEIIGTSIVEVDS